MIWRGGGSSSSTPSVVAGGVQAKGWAAGTLAGGPAYSVAVPDGALALAAIRQLWVQGARANRTSMATAVHSAGCTTPNASKSIACAPGAKAPHACPDTAPTCVGEHFLHFILKFPSIYIRKWSFV